MPVGGTDEPVVMPSGEVAPMLGVGLTIPVTCALATLHTKSAGRRIAAINAPWTRILCFVTISPGAMLTNIGQSLSSVARSFGKSAAAAAQFLVQRLVSLLLPCVEP